MERWGPLLDRLTLAPRENGTPALDDTAQWLLETLTRAGVAAQAVEWTAHPWRLRLVGLGAFLAAVAYGVLLWKGRPLAALAVALLVPTWFLVEFDFGHALAGQVHAVQQKHVVARVPSREPATQRLIFSAHYDTKTDLFDHVERAPLLYLSIPGALLMAITALARLKWKAKALGRAAVGVALVVGTGQLVVQTGGALAPHRSPGATDDGASCAVLLELARAFAAAPLRTTEVELVFFSGEEIGLEGSRAWVRQRFGQSVELPTRAVNLDGVGEAPALMVMKSEAALVRSFDPDAHLISLIDAAQRARLGVPLYRPFYSAATDARAFLEVGVPAVSIGSDLPDHSIARGLHSKKDARERVSLEALDAAVAMLGDVARAVDAETRP